MTVCHLHLGRAAIAILRAAALVKSQNRDPDFRAAAAVRLARLAAEAAGVLQHGEVWIPVTAQAA